MIREFEFSDIEKVKKLADLEIGKDYYSVDELVDIQKRSSRGGVNCSFVLDLDGEIRAFRLSYPPGQWIKGKGDGLTPNKWGVPKNQMAYFQSLFIEKGYRGQGWGRKLSQESIDRLQRCGAQAVLCHSWKESPDNSSFAYLNAMGFKIVAEHPNYWKLVDYTCPRCGQPCLCTAQEMILQFG